jgi:hypothetical protein
VSSPYKLIFLLTGVRASDLAGKINFSY